MAKQQVRLNRVIKKTPWYMKYRSPIFAATIFVLIVIISVVIALC